MGFTDSGINWGNGRRDQLMILAQEEEAARQKAFDEQMSLRMGGDRRMRNPNLPLMGPDIGPQLALENSRRRAMAMTAAEAAQLLTKGKTDVEAWQGGRGGGTGTDESQRPTKGFRGRARGKHARLRDDSLSEPETEPRGPVVRRLQGAQFDYGDQNRGFYR